MDDFPIESIVVLIIAICNLTYLFIMNFVSDYYKQLLAKGWGMVFNVSWILLVMIITAVLLTYNVKCVKTGQCDALAWIIVIILVVLTAGNITWGIYNTIKYKNNEAKN